MSGRISEGVSEWKDFRGSERVSGRISEGVKEWKDFRGSE